MQALKHINKAMLAMLMGVCALGLSNSGPGQDGAKSSADWPIIGGTPGNSHYSSLKQINRSNVAKLQMAWKFDTGQTGGLETTPIVVDGVLYALTPTLQAFALDAATGKLLWTFDSTIKGTEPDRGITYWSSGKERRLFVGVMNFVYALDPATGKAIPSFGKKGRIDLRENLGRDPELQSWAMTSPGVIYKDMMIVGGRNPETLPAPPGDIRAFDVHSGKLRWSFHTIPHPGEPGYETWPTDAWKTAARPTTGRAWRWMRSGALCTCLQVRRSSIFTGATNGQRSLCGHACWRWTPTRASGCGISRVCTTTYGTGIFRRSRLSTR